MPILITEDILKATKQPVAGWTLLQLKEYKRKAAKNQKGTGSVDDYFIFDCIAGPGNTDENAGRVFTVVISGNAMMPGATVPEVAKTLLGLATAMTKMTESELVGQEIAFENMAGTKIWCEIRDDPYQGRILKKPNAFTPDDVVPF